MAVLTNWRHETFAQAIVQGKSYIDAFRVAGYKPHHGNAHRLSLNEEIRARIGELQAVTVEDCEITRESLVARLRWLSKMAAEDGKWAASIAAEREIGVLLGHHIERHETTGMNINVVVPAKSTSIQEWERDTAGYTVLDQMPDGPAN